MKYTCLFFLLSTSSIVAMDHAKEEQVVVENFDNDLLAAKKRNADRKKAGKLPEAYQVIFTFLPPDSLDNFVKESATRNGDQ